MKILLADDHALFRDGMRISHWNDLTRLKQPQKVF